MRSAAGVPPGSLVKCVGGSEPARTRSRARTSVDLPEKSRPSIVTKTPREAPPSLGCGVTEGVALGSGDVGLEELLVLGAGIAHRLGVPLSPHHPPFRQVARFDRLYDPVG